MENRLAIEQATLNRTHVAGHSHAIKDALYKGKQYGVGNDFYFSKAPPFYRKCAFCELNINPGQTGEMEHFRPKGEVHGLDNKPVIVEINGQKVPHPGYYWLVYDSRNLLPACISCNRPGTDRDSGNPIGKRNQFPVTGDYAKAPGEEANEAPLLINPMSPNPDDDPSLHLEMTSEGVLKAKTDRGQACLRVLCLNERDLPSYRKAVYENARDKCGMMFYAVRMEAKDEAQKLLDELRTYINGSAQYSMAGRKAIQDYWVNAKPYALALSGQASTPPNVA